MDTSGLVSDWFVGETESAIGQSVVKAAAKSASWNMSLSKGDIPATLNPAIILLAAQVTKFLECHKLLVVCVLTMKDDVSEMQ